MAEQKAIFVGGNGGLCHGRDEGSERQDLARRYRCEFVELKSFQIQHELFRKFRST